MSCWCLRYGRCYRLSWFSSVKIVGGTYNPFPLNPVYQAIGYGLNGICRHSAIASSTYHYAKNITKVLKLCKQKCSCERSVPHLEFKSGTECTKMHFCSSFDCSFYHIFSCSSTRIFAHPVFSYLLLKVNLMLIFEVIQMHHLNEDSGESCVVNVSCIACVIRSSICVMSYLVRTLLLVVVIFYHTNDWWYFITLSAHPIVSGYWLQDAGWPHFLESSWKIINFWGPGRSLKTELVLESFGVWCKSSLKVLEFKYFLIIVTTC